MSGSVLIVEDSLTVRMDLSEALGDAGIGSILCATIGEAREVLSEQTPDAVILDVVLPDGDGTDLLVELRSRPESAETPVLMLSEEAAIKDRLRGLSHGANAYVGKPYDVQYVVSRVAGFLRATSTGPRRASILVIDDSLTFRETMAELLGAAGFQAITAEGGEDGLQKAALHQPDAVIVDGHMPDIPGIEVIRRLRLDPALRSMPCLLLTGSEQADGEVRALDFGADAYMRKEESAENVLARLGALMRAAESTMRPPLAGDLRRPLRVLAVDDSRTYLEQLAEHLRGEGYDVARATSGEEALELLAVEEVDCILLDLRMPGMSGNETCERIKATPRLRSIPLIMLTAVEQSEAMIEGINAGADDFVSKSADMQVLKARLRAQMRRKRFEDETRRIREQLLSQEAETRTAQAIASAKQLLLDELAAKNAELEFQTAELSRLNAEMQMFAYTVSHDLRQPLRGLDGFSRALQERYLDGFDKKGQHYLHRIRASAQRMAELIDGLLVLSRVSREEITPREVSLGEIAVRIVQRLRDADPGRVVEVSIEPGLEAWADAALIESVLENLVGNAWKFTAKCDAAVIEVGRTDIDGRSCFFVRDNGTGFDMEYADQLFAAFQRLHTREDFEGTGIGLATVQRIIRRHGGRIWAEGVVGEGATFFFTLSQPQEETRKQQ